jgi:hypothetical protein
VWLGITKEGAGGGGSHALTECEAVRGAGHLSRFLLNVMPTLHSCHAHRSKGKTQWRHIAYHESPWHTQPDRSANEETFM